MDYDRDIYLTEDYLKELRTELAGLEQKQEKLGTEDVRAELAAVKYRMGEIVWILGAYKPVILPPEHEQDKVTLGATVLVQTSDGHESEFKIVDSIEANSGLGLISRESPVGLALLGKRVGDKAFIYTGSRAVYTIRHIWYGCGLNGKRRMLKTNQ